MRAERGFTLIELMVSAVILIVITLALTQAFTVQQQTYVVVDQVTESQQNLRAVADLLERDARRAGFLVPDHAAVCGWDDTAGPDTLFVSNTDALRTVFGLESVDEGLVAGNLGVEVEGTGSLWTASGASFALDLEQLWVDVAGDGDDFVVGGGVIVINREDTTSLVACGLITAIDTGSDTLTVNFGDTSIGPVGLGAVVTAIPAHAYTLTPAAGGNPSQFRRNGVLLANDVEDFQVTWFFDLDDDLVVDVGESFGTAGGTNDPFGLTPTANRPNFGSLREVSLSLVTVTRDDDPNEEFTEGAGQVTANRTAGSLPSGDGKRRRVHSARVRLRNVG